MRLCGWWLTGGDKGDGDFSAERCRAAVRCWLTHWRPAWLLQSVSQRFLFMIWTF